MDSLKEKLTQTKLLGIIGVALSIIGVFLTFATVTVSFLGVENSQSASFIEGDGVIVIILSVISLLIILSNLLASKVAFFAKLKNQKLVLIPTIISIIILIMNMASADDVVSSVGSIADVTVSWGIGLWTMWIGLILTAVYSFIYKKEE